MCILPLQRGRCAHSCTLDWWDPTINCVPSTLWWIYWLLIYSTFTPDIEWSKQPGEIKMACCEVCQGQSVARSVTWRQRRAEIQTSQSDATRSIAAYSWTFLRRPKTALLQSVGELFWAGQQTFGETSWRSVKLCEDFVKSALTLTVSDVYVCAKLYFRHRSHREGRL